MSQGITAVHVTHEAIGKIGGIGAVLEGLFTSRAYSNAVGRSILISPLFSIEGDVSSRLGPGGEVLYSSIDGMVNTSYFPGFRKIEATFPAFGKSKSCTMLISCTAGAHSPTGKAV